MVSWRLDMAGKSPVTATDEQKAALQALGHLADRAEADRARALLLTLDGWTSARIAQAFGVREDTVRLWRSDFARVGVDALRVRIAPGPVPFKAQAALRVAAALLSAPVEDRRNWTLSRLADEIARREGLSISGSQLSKVLRKKGGSVSGGPGTG
jgi:transposase